MNTQELRQAEREETRALQETMTNDNFMDVMDKMDAVREKYRILRQEDRLIKDWGFPAEEWATLTKEAKIVILNMAEEAARYERLRDDLQGWLEEAP